MSGGRYERVPQSDDNISLVSLGNYNYLSGVPNSPPPSFHSSQSIDGATTPTHTTPATLPTDQQRSLAPSVLGSTTDSEAVVINLHKRIEQLEETIGRLLLEKENGIDIKSDAHPRSGNCCVRFSNGEPTVAELEALGGGDHCCVTFSSQKAKSSDERRLARVAAFVFSILCLIAAWTILLAFVKSRAVCKVPEGETMDSPQ